jgi:CRP-like cAMP-binding protein
MFAASRPPNLLLTSLSSTDFDLLHPHLRPIELTHQVVLIRKGEPIKEVYFPHSGVISLVVHLKEGETIEAGMVGRDSVFGAGPALNGGIAINDAIVQVAGTASVIGAADLRKAALESITFQAALLRHEQALFVQALQSTACNATHTVEARLSRSLLRARDLAGTDSLALTQEFLGQVLGVKRGSVALVANTLQQAGLIRYRRGNIDITNLEALMESSCECYDAVKEHYDRLTGGRQSDRPSAEVVQG